MLEKQLKMSLLQVLSDMREADSDKTSVLLKNRHVCSATVRLTYTLF